MIWLFWIRVVRFIFTIIFLILQFRLLYPSVVTSCTFPFISVHLSTINNTTSSLAIHKSRCCDMSTTPRLAYFISGSADDGEMVKRILQAISHLNNFYIGHLDRTASSDELNKIFYYINNNVVFLTIGNVVMIDKPNVVSENGPTKIANVLHAAAISLKEGGKWDWFINLDTSSYPLVTQDGSNN